MNPALQSVIAGVCAALVTVAVMTWLVRPHASPPTDRETVREEPRPAREPVRPEKFGVEIAALQDALDRESEQRRELASNVETLRTLLEESLEIEVSNPTPDEEKGPGFDEEALVAAGVSRAEAGRLHDRFDGYELERLELIDAAARDGWAFGRRRQAFEELESELQEELGEELYDRMLYGAGQNNRVVVRDVISRSQADGAGLQPDDVILRYSGERVFDVFSLQRLTQAGERDDDVEVQILRDGGLIVAYVARGPLGVKLRAESMPPLRLP